MAVTMEQLITEKLVELMKIISSCNKTALVSVQIDKDFNFVFDNRDGNRNGKKPSPSKNKRNNECRTEYEMKRFQTHNGSSNRRESVEIANQTDLPSSVDRDVQTEDEFSNEKDECTQTESSFDVFDAKDDSYNLILTEGLANMINDLEYKIKILELENTYMLEALGERKLENKFST